MPEGPDGKTIIIVKKVSGHGGHHGGAWKVAYADFVTAMMALFMVLWLVNSAAEPTRQRIASYFRKPGIFQKGSGTPIEIGGGGILPDAFSPTTDGNSQIQASDKIYHVDAVTGKVKELYDPGNGSKEFRYAPALDGGADRGTSGETNLQLQKLAAESEIEQKKLEDLKTEIQKIIEEKAGGDGKEDGKQSAIESILGEIEIKLDKRGLVIEIMDTEKSSMFQVGQAGVQAEAEAKLLEIGKLISKVSNPIDIEGHTDARPYKSKDGSYDNWNLSSDRANAARRVLEKSGFKKGQIARVVGYADERPRDQENPLNPANRRITISMRYSNKAKEALDGTNLFETASGQKVKNNPKGTAPALKPTTLKSLEEKKPKESDSFVTAAPTVVTKEEKVATPEAVVVPEVESTKEQEQGLKMEISTVTEEGGSPEEYQTPPLDEEKKELIFGKDAKFFKK
jgi:chemotaxis protein MotB